MPPKGKLPGADRVAHRVGEDGRPVARGGRQASPKARRRSTTRPRKLLVVSASSAAGGAGGEEPRLGARRPSMLSSCCQAGRRRASRPRPRRTTTLLRRLYYDLTGLPPTPAEVDAFVADESPDAYEKSSIACSHSPHYGESWARHWLDLVRYAETNSYERDGPKPFAWRYRDYVIRSLQRRQAVRPVRPRAARRRRARPRRRRTRIIATGYYRLGIWDDEPADPLQARYDELDDIVADDRPGVPRPDGQLRPLPRPQDRPVPAEGLLPAARVLPRHQRPRLAASNGSSAAASTCAERSPTRSDRRAARRRSPAATKGDRRLENGSEIDARWRSRSRSTPKLPGGETRRLRRRGATPRHPRASTSPSTSARRRWTSTRPC